MKILITIVSFCISAGFSWGQLPNKPSPPRAYNDFTGESFLNKNEAETIEQELVEFEKKTSNAIVVIVVNDLKKYSIEQFADEIGEKWGVGDAKKDNGIVFLIKPSGEGKREVTLQIGRGLEGVIPDLTCIDIIDNEFLPNMKKGSAYKATHATIQVLKALALKEFNHKDYHKKNQMNWVSILIIMVIVCFVIYALIKGNKGGGTTMGAGGIFLGGFGGQRGGGGFGGGGGGFGGFGGGSFGGGGASGSW